MCAVYFLSPACLWSTIHLLFESIIVIARCSKTYVVLFFATFCLLLFGAVNISAGVEAGRHPHNGKLPAYDGAPPDIKLTNKEQKKLEQGKPVRKIVKLDGNDRGVAVFRVNASPSVVWSVISDFEMYPDWDRHGDRNRRL